MEYQFINGTELLNQCLEKNKKIWEVMLEREVELSDHQPQMILDRMTDFLMIMKEAVTTGIYTEVKSVSGLIGGDAKRYMHIMKQVNLYREVKPLKLLHMPWQS